MHLHDYETTFIFRPDLDEAEHNRLTNRLKAIIADNGGDLMLLEDWGRRRLAYDIKKQSHGHYLFFNYAASPTVPAELERIIKIEDNIVRFLTIVNDRYVDPEEIRLVARARQRKRLARAQAGAVDAGSDRGRGRSPRESMVPPGPVSAPTGSAIVEAPAAEEEGEAAEAVEAEAEAEADQD